MSLRAAARAAAALSAVAAAACALSSCMASRQPIHLVHHRTSPAILALAGSWKASIKSKVTIHSKVTTGTLTDRIVVYDDGTFTDSYQLILPIGQQRTPELFVFTGSGKVEWLGGDLYRFRRLTSYKPGTLTASWNFTARLSVNHKKLFTTASRLTQVFYR